MARYDTIACVRDDYISIINLSSIYLLSYEVAGEVRFGHDLSIRGVSEIVCM